MIEAARERLDADERELMEHIDAAASRLSGQVRGLMEVAQVALGRETGEQVALEVAIRDAIDALRAAAVECGAEIEVQDPVPAVDVPRTELSAVLQNVISNAIKYRREGVTPRIVIAAEKGETIIEVRVADNGVGLSDDGAGPDLRPLRARRLRLSPGPAWGLRSRGGCSSASAARSSPAPPAAARARSSPCSSRSAAADGQLGRGLRGRLEARGLLEVAVGARRPAPRLAARSASNAEKTRIAQSGRSVRSEPATWSPSSSGIARSSTTTSGASERASASASAPSAASATSSSCGCALIARRSSRRISEWSSASSTRARVVASDTVIG